MHHLFKYLIKYNIEKNIDIKKVKEEFIFQYT